MKFLKRSNEKLNYLKWWDILIITAIMFGYFIYSSTKSFFYLQDTKIAQTMEFTKNANWQSLVLQLGLLVIAFIYLYLRNFNFSNWKINVNLRSILMGIIIFLGVGLLFDIYYTIVYTLFPVDSSMAYNVQEASRSLSVFENIDLSLILYSALNGFYEEIFFLGICLSVKPEKRMYYVMYSLIIRYSFHTYQGNVSALAIGFLVGGIYYFLYTRSKDKNLFPLIFSHQITDVFGAGIISYFF